MRGQVDLKSKYNSRPEQSNPGSGGTAPGRADVLDPIVLPLESIMTQINLNCKILEFYFKDLYFP